MLPSLPVKWAEFAPDQSDYNPNYTDAILNVFPTMDGYGPLPDWAQQGSATLGGAPKGGITVRLANGTPKFYCGTATKLKVFNTVTLAFDDVTRSSGGDYTTADADDWSFAQFGALLIACNGADATQFINVDSGTNFAALSNAPKGKFVIVVGDFVVLLHLPDVNRRALAWSGVNDATFWTYGQRGSDLQTLPDGGAITGGIGTDAGAVIFQQDKNRTMQRVDGPMVFAIRILHENIGCFAPYSVCGVRNTFFWYDQGGFYEGLAGNPIGAEKVNQFVLNNSTANYRKTMRSAVDPIRKVAWWLVQDSDSNRYMLGYNWITQKWTRADFNVAYIFQAVSPGTSFGNWDDYGATFGDLPYTFGSQVWEGSGVRLWAGIKTDGSFGYFDSTNMVATLETNDLEINPGGSGFVNAMRLISDAPVASVSGLLASRAFPGASLSWSTERSADTGTGRVWPNPGKRGATHRSRFKIAAGTTWNNATGAQLHGRAAGI